MKTNTNESMKPVFDLLIAISVMAWGLGLIGCSRVVEGKSKSDGKVYASVEYHHEQPWLHSRLVQIVQASYPHVGRLHPQSLE